MLASFPDIYYLGSNSNTVIKELKVVSDAGRNEFSSTLTLHA